MELVQNWAADLTKEYHQEGNSKEWYDDIVKKCVDVGDVKTDIQTCDFYLKQLHRRDDIVGVIGTLHSHKFMNGYSDDPDKAQPDLILSIHGLRPGDSLKIGSPNYDLFGEDSNFSFLQPFNQSASPYSPGVVVTKHHPLTDITLRAVWIWDEPTRKQLLYHSSKTQKIIYNGNRAFCIYRGQHIPWEYRNFIF
jgi:hypothetical protein